VLHGVDRMGTEYQCTKSATNAPTDFDGPVDQTTVNYMLAWGIAAAIATLGGVFLAINSFAIDPTFGGAALVAFPAIILGGIDSVSGAVVGGIVIGVIQVLTAGYESRVANVLGAGIHEITPYLIMILVLLIRPYGLFGTRKVERI